MLLPNVASAHERFIKHELLEPLQRDFFRRLDPNMLNVGLRVAGLMAIMLFIWFLRDPLYNFVENQLVRKLRGKPKEWLHLIHCFVADKPVEHPWFRKVGEWVVILFLRTPALVLMYSATNDSLVMPSYPLEPSTLLVFKYAQVIMAMGIITQAFLPFGGGDDYRDVHLSGLRLRLENRRRCTADPDGGGSLRFITVGFAHARHQGNQRPADALGAAHPGPWLYCPRVDEDL